MLISQKSKMCRLESSILNLKQHQAPKWEPRVMATNFPIEDLIGPTVPAYLNPNKIEATARNAVSLTEFLISEQHRRTISMPRRFYISSKQYLIRIMQILNEI